MEIYREGIWYDRVNNRERSKIHNYIRKGRRANDNMINGFKPGGPDAGAEECEGGYP